MAVVSADGKSHGTFECHKGSCGDHENYTGGEVQDSPASKKENGKGSKPREEQCIYKRTVVGSGEIEVNLDICENGDQDGANVSIGGDRENSRQSSFAVVKDRCGTVTNYSLGVFVRLLLIGGNALAAWRTVVETDNTIHWALVLVCVILMMAENATVIFKMRGLEWTWWSPCFLVYFGTTLPLVWQMQLRQRENYIAKINSVEETYSSGQGSADNLTGYTSTTTEAAVQLQDISWRVILSISNGTWVIVVNESVVYLVIFSRWLLPRGDMSREFLADTLLEFLAMASDIMELLALFDESKVRENLMLNYWILIAWSASLLQFIPKLVHKRKYRRIKSLNVACLRKACGNGFTEVLATLMNIVLQDGSFLFLRLYVMVQLNFVTYSLTFFVMKNLLSLLLLFYRLIILIHNLPCCCGKKYQLSNSLRRSKAISYE